MQRLHIAGRLGERRAGEVSTEEVEAIAEAMIKRGLWLKTVRAGRYEVEKTSRSLIKRHVFPGGSLPFKQAIERFLQRATNLHPATVRDLTEHYPPTLRACASALKPRDANRLRRALPSPLAPLPELLRGGCFERRVEVSQLLLTKHDNHNNPQPPSHILTNTT
jgi:hypothetical protein